MAAAVIDASADDTSADTSEADAIVLAAVASLRRRSFHEAGFGTLSEDSGVPVEDLRRCFPAWNDLLIAVITRWTAERMRPVTAPNEDPTAAGYLRRIVVANLRDPALVRLLIAMTSSTSHRPDSALSRYLAARSDGFHARVVRAVAADVERAAEPADLEPERAAEQLMLLFDGLQLQWMVRPDIDVMRTFDRSVAELRSAWRNPHLASA